MYAYIHYNTIYICVCVCVQDNSVWSVTMDTQILEWINTKPGVC